MSSRPRFAFFRRARFRLTLYYTAMFLVFLSALCALLYYRTRKSMLKQLDRFMRDEHERLADWMAERPDNIDAIKSHLHYMGLGERYYELSFRVLDPTGKPVATSELFDQPGLVPPISPEALQGALSGGSYVEQIELPDRRSQLMLLTRPFALPSDGVRYVVQILCDLDPVDRLSRHFLHIIYSVVPGLVLLSWFGGYTLARKVLRPINLMSRTARRITSTRLDERLVRTNSGDEFDQLAATLNEMIERLEKSFELLRQFAADAAHELRTPLTIMKGEAEIALRGKDADPEVYRDTLESTTRECDRMIAIISNLLMLARADSGDIRFRREPFRLDLLLAELAETFQVLAEEAGLSLEADEFPEIVVDGDGTRLHELFANLLDNAVKYTPPGGRIRIACELNDAEVYVSVSDTGVGIPEDELDRIFDRFYRVDHSRSRETGGSGLGLSIAKWIAEAHRGRIEVESSPGAGSTFTVALTLHGVRRVEPPELPQD